MPLCGEYGTYLNRENGRLIIRRPMGVVAGLVNTPNQSAKEIVDEIVSQAAEILGSANRFVTSKSKL